MTKNNVIIGLVILFSTTQLVRPDVYAAVGLDPDQAHAVARVNPHWRATKSAMAAKVLGVLEQAGLVGRSNRLLRRAGVLPLR